MIARLSTSIARFIRKNNEQAASEEVLMYSLTIVLNAAFITVVVLGVSLITGRFAAAAIMLASFVFLRFFSGGMHLPSSQLCNALSIGSFVVLLHLPVDYWNTGFALNLIALILVAVLAPTNDMMQLNLLGPKFAILFKFVSIALVTSNFWIQSPAMSLALCSQAVSLTPIAYKAVALLERR